MPCCMAELKKLNFFYFVLRKVNLQMMERERERELLLLQNYFLIKERESRLPRSIIELFPPEH